MNLGFQDLFPTRLWTLQADTLMSLHPAWIQEIHAMREQQPMPAGRSSRGGWNSHGRLLEIETFKPLKAALIESLQIILREAGNTGELKLGLTAWANVHDTGGFNTLHLHPNNVFSGAYYIKVPDAAGPIVFRDPRYASLMTPLEGRGEAVRQFASVKPAEGQMLIFPSWLEHRVEENKSPEQRISIAFNVSVRR